MTFTTVRGAATMAAQLLAGAAAAGSACAQSAFPSRPIRLVVPFPAGGAPDIESVAWFVIAGPTGLPKCGTRERFAPLTRAATTRLAAAVKESGAKVD